MTTTTTGPARRGGERRQPIARARLPSLRWPTSRIAPRAVPLMAIENASAVTPGVMYVHADHLDRPVRMTAQTKAGLGTAVYRPFGDVHSIGGTRTLDLRFPGQWFQLETGLHYNWHRHYDPTTGRYLQPDPLGFVDGAGVYGYAGGVRSRALTVKVSIRWSWARPIADSIRRVAQPSRKVSSIFASNRPVAMEARSGAVAETDVDQMDVIDRRILMIAHARR